MALLLVSCIGAATASEPAAVRNQVESTLLVKGMIDLDANGRVDGYTLERQETLPPGIIALFARVVPQWRFEPVQIGGKASATRESMSLRLVAKKLDNGNFRAEIRGAHFGQARPGESVSGANFSPPNYPEAAAKSGVGGIAYLVLKIARDGRVEDAVAEQVNLRVIDGKREMKLWRELLARAALQAATRWTFKPPTAGEEVGAKYWSVRVPVDFIAGQHKIKDHEWQAYVPGPRQAIPWIADSSALPAADALAAGGVYPLNSAPRLLTSLNPS